ncbi:MAG: HAD family hydrolase [Halobacteriota archaeon]
MALIAFDFDGTVTQSDLLVLLGREYDVAGEIRGLAEQGYRGDQPFATTLRHRTSLLEGMPERRVAAAFDRCKLRKGIADLIADLRRSGNRVAIVTGSFERGVETALDRAGVSVDHVIANRLVIENGAVTGAVAGPLLDRDKGEALQELVIADGIDLGETIAVGNGATDLPMLKIAATAVGFKPDPIVEGYCDYVVTSVRRLQLYFDQHDIVE